MLDQAVCTTVHAHILQSNREVALDVWRLDGRGKSNEESRSSSYQIDHASRRRDGNTQSWYGGASAMVQMSVQGS